MIIPKSSFLILFCILAEGLPVYLGGIGMTKKEWEEWERQRILDLPPSTFQIGFTSIRFKLGSVLMIETEISERMDIYLQSNLEKSDIPLHISVRPEEEAIVFNSFIKNAWDEEERRRIPFSLNSVMPLRITIEKNRFLIRIGEDWFKSFDHRMSFKLIKQLYIVGFKDIPLIEWDGIQEIG